MTIKLPYKLLEYDIETGPLQANVWSLGEQTVRHGQLVKGHDNYCILTISYKWFDSNKVYALDYTDPKMLEKFDKEIRKAEMTIGKNSDRFDVKHINTQRMLQGLKPLPEWVETTDDLEKQLRRYFVFPSQSLDYISNLFGFGGKEKMELKDWTDIMNYKQITQMKVDCKGLAASKLSSICTSLFKDSYNNVIKKGKAALKKMIFYNKKDVLDTDAILKRVLPYIKLKHNAASSNEGKGCITCGSLNLIPTKMIIKGQTKYQQFECLEHSGYGGKATIKYNKNRNKVYGKMQ